MIVAGGRKDDGNQCVFRTVNFCFMLKIHAQARKLCLLLLSILGLSVGLKIGCVGDSITFGVHASGQNMSYPSQLGQLLGDEHEVVNLGESGATMQKKGDHPYWNTTSYQLLVNSTWYE